MALFIIISIILHLLTLFGLILLWQRVQKKEAETNPDRLVKEVEDVFASYLLEMKEENDKLLEAIENRSKKAPETNPETSEPPALEKKYSTPLPHNDPNGVRNDPNDYSPPLDDDHQEQYSKSMEAQAMLMKKQGMSIEQIAKTLNKGKTEIELMLKFHR